MTKSSERIRELRTLKGWSQRQLAERIGMSQQSVGGYEKSNANPPKYNICKRIADEFGVTVSYIMGFTDNPTEEAVPKQTHEQLAHYLLTPDEAQFIEHYRACSQMWKDNLMMDALSAAGQTRRDADAATAASSACPA